MCVVLGDWIERVYDFKVGRGCGKICEVGFDVGCVVGLGDCFVCVFDFDGDEVGFVELDFGFSWVIGILEMLDFFSGVNGDVVNCFVKELV